MGDHHTYDDTISSLARTLAERVRWEMEHGAIGYAGTMSSPAVIQENARSGKGGGRAQPPVNRRVASPGTALRPMSNAGPATTDPAADLVALRSAIGECTRCGLHAGRNHIVFGEGDPQARIVFVGEGPGRDEDLVGRPFVGAAGQLLSRIIQAMGLTREDVYICNVVKCRPPQNRTPTLSEQRICGAFLQRQLAVIAPKVVVALGSVAATYLLGADAPVGKLRGKFHTTQNLNVMPTYHPAYLLRNPGAKREVWQDIQQVMAAVGT
jgi:uracil-DNA glycosylase